MSNSTKLSLEEMNAIVGGYHGNPFAVLGRHEQNNEIVVRTYEPMAHAVSVITDTGIHPMHKVHDGGLFECVLSQINSYELQIEYDGRAITQRPDTYSFSSSFSDLDLYLHGEGTDRKMYEKLGAHEMEHEGVRGVRFAVWAPNAERASVVGNFNSWDGRRNPMRFHAGSGIWEIFIPTLGNGELYRYELKTTYQGYMVTKTDPVGFFQEMRPKKASIVWDVDDYEWGDSDWIKNRGVTQAKDQPMSVYELHLGSWQRSETNEWLTYREIADRLIPYIQYMGYTHIELMPVAEHPLDASWGYQVTGYFAPTSRFGTPQDFMHLVDACHQAGIGVLLDWVPAHFPKDEHGLGFFDGTNLYEHSDPRLGEHPDWGTLIFNYERNEVRQFLIANALYWFDKFHIDGLRVDAVASMLYLDFSREADQWIPNKYGSRENLAAIDFLRELNTVIREEFPTVLMIAEESTAWAGVTNDPKYGGLGFHQKWNMGWMNDTLRYMEEDPVHRSFHHGVITFSMLYAFSESFVLPFSHDEVVHGKGNMINKMPGDNWQKFANLRALYGYMFGHPGAKLQFMGTEFGQWEEWDEDKSLDWHLVQEGWPHKQLQEYVRELNALYTGEKSLHEVDDDWRGFQWLVVQDSARSVLGFIRRAKDQEDFTIVITNFTPMVREDYRIGVPIEGTYVEVLNSDLAKFGGSGVSNPPLKSEPLAWQDQSHSIHLTIPPLGTIYLKLKK